MKNIFFIALLSFVSLARADVSVEKSQIQNMELTLTVSGEEAKALKALVTDYDGATDSVVAKGAGADDYSAIRSVQCASDECNIKLQATAYDSKGTQEYYSREFNQKLRSLQPEQVLVVTNPKDLSGVKTAYEARLLRLMIENPSGLKNISCKRFKPQSLTKTDVVASPLYEVRFELPSLSIICYSSIVTGMGVQNFLSESCSVTATALLR